ncbi:G-type lectin S-receptor-like serine/threonine-protein kinase At4g27290 [Camellia sinensis]|uniref:G-type lectin S-receptor-like serine/threonine-protein kinase At4g27290 n=1 Tax=Camellia sinensis TaxID=4442 RepID=UPI0010358671|nr:G-type lectin S-receptor-like serine/threonine-protein kinase At4g27290 [Camellia sinensis]
MAHHMSSWKCNDDPAQGDYTYWLDLHGYPQIFVSKGSVVLFRAGPWNGLWFTGTETTLTKNPIFKFGLYFEKDEIYYWYDLLNSSVASRFILTPNGFAQRWTWINQNKGWVLYVNAPPTVNYDSYNLCGADGSCDVDKSPYSGVKLPDMLSSWCNRTMTLGECREVCLKNCSCMAYTSLDIREGGSGCLLWYDDLVDIRLFNEGGRRESINHVEFGNKIIEAARRMSLNEDISGLID